MLTIEEKESSCANNTKRFATPSVDSDDRFEVEAEKPTAVVDVQKPQVVESYFTQPIDHTNQCIGQLFSMSTVFPLSILRN